MTNRNNRNNRDQAAPPRTLEVITTHLNADFDAMASMVAAKKLYPEALLVFPGSQERNLRDFFIRSSFYFVDFTRMKQVPLEEIKRLILVDTRQASRIGKFAEVAASGEVDIHIYDHHPDTDEDVHGSLEVVEEIGGGVANGRKFKAVQIGGPSGGCVPSWKADTPIDFESLKEVA